MRRLLFLLSGLSLLAGLTGCHAVTGKCDCADLPPQVVAAHPVGAEQPTALPVSYTEPALASQPMIEPGARGSQQSPADR